MHHAFAAETISKEEVVDDKGTAAGVEGSVFEEGDLSGVSPYWVNQSGKGKRVVPMARPPPGIELKGGGSDEGISSLYPLPITDIIPSRTLSSLSHALQHDL